MSSISFVIPVLNGELYLRQCLESIERELLEGDEILVMDNGSTDQTLSIIHEHPHVMVDVYPGVTIAALRNRGAARASKDLLAFIDADCRLASGWRRSVQAVMSDSSVHATGSQCTVPEGAGWIERAWFSQRSSQQSQVEWLNTANLIVRKDVFVSLGGFDESLISNEDCEFGERLNHASYRMIESPMIRVDHLDNPKSLREFYKREQWHATSDLASTPVSRVNLSTVASILFGIALVIGFVAVPLSLLLDIRYLWLLLPVIVIPLGTVISRARRFENYRYVAALALLWSVLFVARLSQLNNRAAQG